MTRVLLMLLVSAAVASPQARQAAMPEPGTAGLNLPAQPIGPNDLVAVSVYDTPEFTRTVRVGADGLIRLPMMKTRIDARGKMPADVEAALAGALKAEGLIVDPFVTVTIVEYHSRPISVAGAVRKPLVFQAAGPVTLLDALSRAEGLSAEAGSEILVTRPPRDAAVQSEPPGSDTAPAPVYVQRIPVKALIDAADPEMNIQLTGGEEIRVPDVGRVYVVGNVRRPGAFPVKDDDHTTVLKMLALSEGLMPFAAKQAFIYRREGGKGGKNEIPIELKKILARQSPDVPLLANDILYIPDNSGRRTAITILERAVLFGTTATATAVAIRR